MNAKRNHRGWVDLRALFAAIGFSLTLAGLTWIVAQLQVSDRITGIETRLHRIEILLEAHMEGHPQTVRDTIYQHIQDRIAHPVVSAPHGPEHEE